MLSSQNVFRFHSMRQITAVNLLAGVLLLGFCGQQLYAQPTTYDGAMRWYEKEAKIGSAKAQFLLGVLYSEGVGSRSKDQSAAFSWFQKAAQQGHASAQYKLGSAYQFGLGITRNISLAEKWYRRAAEKGITEAQHNLGYLLENGLGVEKSEDDAVIWYRKAARSGLGASQLAVGYMYLRGKGVKEDPAEAWAWFRAAVSRETPNARQALEIAEKVLRPTQLNRAKRLANMRIRKIFPSER